jgi:GNAT superfamily N-acetyltransferase
MEYIANQLQVLSTQLSPQVFSHVTANTENLLNRYSTCQFRLLTKDPKNAKIPSTKGQVLLLGIQYPLDNKNWNFYLQVVSSEGFFSAGHLMAVRSGPSWGFGSVESLHIGDFSFGENYQNGGTGSWVLSILFEMCQTMHIKQITGDIKSRDWEHVDMLHHFYTKHGFEVALDKIKREGTIRKLL